MLSIVNYGASDSENEITDDEEEPQNGIINGNDEDILKKPTTIKLPEPAVIHNIIEEDDDEFLHKKEIPEVRPPPKIKEKVKIMIPKLSDFKDEEEEKKIKKYPTATNKKSGLLGMLPKPSHYIGPSAKQPQIIIPSKPSPSIAPEKLKSSSSQDQPSTKKIGFIPYALMDHKKAADDKKLAKKAIESDSDDEEDATSFFTFSSKDDDLPKVSEEEIKSLIAKEADRIEQRKRQNEDEKESEDDFHEQQYSQHYQQESNIDQDAMKALAGGSRAKRSKMGDVQIVDLTDNDVLPNREEWLRKTLAGETSYLPTGQIDDKVGIFFQITFNLKLLLEECMRKKI